MQRKGRPGACMCLCACVCVCVCVRAHAVRELIRDAKQTMIDDLFALLNVPGRFSQKAGVWVTVQYSLH